MRIAPWILVACVSCGGSQKPAESVADTTSLESKDSNAGKSEAPAASAEPPRASSAPAEPSPAAAAAPAAAPSHPAPSVTGAIDGKPFAPKVARTTGKAQKDGRIVLALDESHTDCSDANAQPQPGDAMLTMLVPWEDGYKADLGSLKRSTPKKAGEITFSRVGPGGKKVVSATFKPSGTVTIVKAPNDSNATGKMKIDLQSGDYMLAGDLDVLVCGPTK
jgi:hypothetical protein